MQFELFRLINKRAREARARHLPLDVSVAAADQRRAEHLHAARSRAAAAAVYDARQEGEVPPAREMDLPQRRPHRHRFRELEARHRGSARCGPDEGDEHLRGRVRSPRRIATKPEEIVRREVEGTFGLKYKDYFLFYGSIEPKKNIGRMLQGYLTSGVDDAARDRRRAGLEIRAGARPARRARRAQRAPPRRRAAARS